MTREVSWSADAAEDIVGIIDYIAADNPVAARKVLAAIRSAGEGLAFMLTGRPGRVTGTYEKIVRGLPYIIAYAIRPLPAGGEVVAILRVIHGARNWPEEQWPE